MEVHSGQTETEARGADRLHAFARRGSMRSSFLTVWEGSFRTARSPTGSLAACEGEDQLQPWRLPVRHFPVSVALLRLWYLLLIPPLLCVVTLPLEAVLAYCNCCCCCRATPGDLVLGRTPIASPYTGLAPPFGTDAAA